MMALTFSMHRSSPRHTTRPKQRTGRRRSLSLTLLGASLALFACEHEVSSSDLVRTRNLYGEFRAESDGSGTVVTARLLQLGANGEPYEDLRDGDSLSAEVGGQSKGLSLEDGFFTATFDEDDDGTAVQILFRRTDDESATRTNGALPDAFDVSLPDGASEARRGETTIEWDADQRLGALSFQVSGDCIETSSGTFRDESPHTFGASDIRAAAGSDGESCDVTLIMRRTRGFNTDPALERGGRFDTVQTRQLTFTSLPSWEELGLEPPTMSDAGMPPDAGMPSGNEDAGESSSPDAGDEPTDAGAPPNASDASSVDAGPDSGIPSDDAG